MAKCKAKLADGKRCNLELPRGKKYCRMHSPSLFKFKQTTYAIGKALFGTQENNHPDYDEYLKSEKWKTRAARERRFNPNCSLCNRKGLLHVHHRTYVRLGNEKQGDLVVLCDDCHSLFHRFYRYDSKVGYFIPTR